MMSTIECAQHAVCCYAGANLAAIGKAAAEEAAWAKLQRSAAWWLGEFANPAAEEYAGSLAALRDMAGFTKALRAQKRSPAELMALQVVVLSPPQLSLL